MRYLLTLALLSATYADDLSIGYFVDNEHAQIKDREQLLASEEKRAEEDEKILIPHLEAIVLVGDYENVSSKYAKMESGVYAVDLHIPGGLESLQKELLPLFKERELTARDLFEIKKTIILHFQNNHHPLVTVHIPEQEVTQGVLQLVVTQGRLEKVESYGANWFSNRKIANQIRIKEGEVIDEQRLLEDLQWINSNPFHRTDVIYAPGKKPDSTVIELITKDRLPIRIYAGVDNTGLESIGTNRFFTGATWGNAFNANQQLSYQYTSSFQVHKFKSMTAHWEIPLPWRHTFLVYGGYSTTHPEIRDSHFSSKGESTQASGRYTIPLQPKNQLLHEVTFGFDFKRTNTNVLFSEVPILGKLANIAQFMLGYSLAHDTRKFKTSFEADLFYSPGEMVGDQTKRDYASLRPGAKPTYLYGRLLLEERIRLPKEWSFCGNIRAQASTTPLLPSEQFGLGGYDTIRGYEERSYQGDDAFYASCELRTPLWNLFWRKRESLFHDQLQLLAFFDYGYGFNLRKPPGEPKTDFLMSVGPGLRYTIGQYVSIRADWGVKLHKIPHDSSDSRVHFSAILSY
jgi:hemolysin activation/secretion protein